MPPTRLWPPCAPLPDEREPLSRYADTDRPGSSPRYWHWCCTYWTIGDIAPGGRVGRASGAWWIEVAPDWTERLFGARAPYLFEPVLAVHPLPQLTILLSPVNLVLGGLLAGLVGLNLTVAAYAAAQATSCRRAGYGRLLTALPALLTGVACCVPTFLVVLGSSTAAVLLPVVVPLRMLFYPLSLVLLTATLIWGTRRP